MKYSKDITFTSHFVFHVPYFMFHLLPSPSNAVNRNEHRGKEKADAKP